jgi:putative ABC transport system ATP-binding protein
MRRLRESGKTILMASHDPIVYDSELAERRLELRDGRLVEAGTPR